MHTTNMLIDGRECSWGEFERMLLTREGWQFKLEILDSSPCFFYPNY